MAIKTREFTHSELSTYQECPQKWWFKYHEMLSPKRQHPRLFFGSAIHEALDVYYSKGEDASRSYFLNYMDRVTKEEIDNGERDKLVQMYTMGSGMLDMYYRWAKASDNFKVIGSEKRFTVPIICPVSKRKSTKYLYTFTLDQIVEYQGTYWIQEFKTTKTIDSNYIQNLALDEQVSRYTWAMEKKMGIEIQGVFYTMLRKAVAEVPKPIKAGTGLSRAISIDTTYDIYMKAIKDHGFNPTQYREILEHLQRKGNTFIRREAVFRSKEEKEATAQRLYTLASLLSTMKPPLYKCPSRDCGWKCEFRSLCIEDTKDMREAWYVVRDQYHPEHAKEAEQPKLLGGLKTEKFR